MPDTPNPEPDDRCASVHWSLPVQCVLKCSHAENWHEAWHPESGNRLRYRYPGSLTEELHHDEWHRIVLPKPDAEQVVAAPAYVWTYNDDDGEEFTGPYATEALARAEAEAEWIGSYVDPSSAGTLSWSMLKNTPECYILQEDGKSVGIHLWRQEVLGAAEPEVITTADQLRALPVGTVLLDPNGMAHQLYDLEAGRTLVDTAIGMYCLTPVAGASDDDLLDGLARPLHVLHTPGGHDAR